MSGRAATAWFELPWELATELVSPDLLPEKAPTLRSRVRFYDLEFHACDVRAGRELEVRSGRFREGAFGVPVRAGDLAGETSLFLWTDSEDYLIWGREAFGWPVRLARISYEGPLWERELQIGATGNARLEDPWGEVALLEVEVTDAAESGTPRGCWVTPRRLLHHDGGVHETRELLAVRPVVRRTGDTFAARGRLAFAFRAPHPLSALGEVDAVVEAADGFELLVGAETRVVPRPRKED